MQTQFMTQEEYPDRGFNKKDDTTPAFKATLESMNRSEAPPRRNR
jgi:hypothetical protein